MTPQKFTKLNEAMTLMQDGAVLVEVIYHHSAAYRLEHNGNTYDLAASTYKAIRNRVEAQLEYIPNYGRFNVYAYKVTK